jgi:tetratricopeptide (TPR) repeat protein
MRKKTAILAALIGCVLLAAAAWAQNAPRMKSQKELDAWNAINAAPNVGVQLQKIDDFLTAFPDSDFRLVLLDRAADLAANKNDYPLTMAWGQRDLDANPNSFVAMLSLAKVTAATTKEFDLDKEQKLAQAEKWANTALDILRTAPRPVAFAEDKWPLVRKYYESSGYLSLGLVAMDRKKYDAAAGEFQKAFDTVPEPVYLVRVGEADVKATKYDNAIAAFDKVLATQDLNPVVKQVAERDKNEALRHKGVPPAAAAAPITPAAQPAPAAPSAPAASPAPAPGAAPPVTGTPAPADSK